MNDYRYLYGLPESPLTKRANFCNTLHDYFGQVLNRERPFQKTAAEKCEIVGNLLEKYAGCGSRCGRKQTIGKRSACGTGKTAAMHGADERQAPLPPAQVPAPSPRPFYGLSRAAGNNVNAGTSSNVKKRKSKEGWSRDSYWNLRNQLLGQ